MVMRQQPMALHARRSLIPHASRRWTTAFRFPAGLDLGSASVVGQNELQTGLSPWGKVIAHRFEDSPS